MILGVQLTRLAQLEPFLPRLEGDALRAVRHRGSHVQIIAAAGSGKTEVVSQRVAALIADGVPAEAIVAFTFTERASEELKERISLRVEGLLGPAARDQLGRLYVGTIHAYCFRLLQQRVPRYESYDVLDDNQLTAFLSREANRLGIKQLDPAGRQFAAIQLFLRSVAVVENELLEPPTMPDPFGSVLGEYLVTLERYRLLTYGQQVARAVEELERPEVRSEVHSQLRHLIVDEYQDVNPAQERLIERLTGPQVELCVVGDDEQAVYQWRGSDVANIVDFEKRYPEVATFRIETNRRSRPHIVETANRVARTILGRLPKTMLPHRPAVGDAPQVVLWHQDDELSEAGWIANMILDLNDRGVRFRDIAVLVRSRAVYAKLVDQFSAFDIPVQSAGRTGLFDQPEARVLGRTVCWLTGQDWRDQFGPPTRIADVTLLDEFERAFALTVAARRRVGHALEEWKALVPRTSRTANLVGEFYELLDVLDVRSWDLSDRMQVNRLGTMARFTALLAEYESVRRRARPDPDQAGEQVGGQDRGEWYYRNLGIHIVNYAQGAYEGFDGEIDIGLDAVDLTTVHKAKGLEWPVVFIPSVTANRFPTSRVGQVQNWLLPRDRFAAARYEGTDADERRLFYVAMTRARDWLSVSRHDRVTRNAVQPSPYYLELADLEAEPSTIEYPPIEVAPGGDEVLEVTYSELATFLECGMAYRLRNLLGFQPRLAPELGYGKAVHHVLRTVADVTGATGQVPSEAEIDGILDESFFLPTANKAAHRQLKSAARRLVSAYATHHADDLHRVWESERPFELRLDGITVTGRADVILDREGGKPTALAILDYKTSTTDEGEHELQLQVYADAGRREGLDVRAAYVHDLKASSRAAVDVTGSAVAAAEGKVSEAGRRVRARDFAPNPGLRCRACEVRTVCGSAIR
jgi:DNA helicase-2/ATP-dependent DNA helicase PcrA